MSTRYLIAALLMTSACVAHADVTTSTSSQSGFVTDWTTGNGGSVIGSGVLSDNTSLVGGVMHGSSANMVQALYQQASANAAQTGGAVKLTYSQGIAADYLTSTSNAMLVAMLGGGKSAVRSPNGVIITDAPQNSGNVGNSGGGSGGAAPAGGGSVPAAPAGTDSGSIDSGAGGGQANGADPGQDPVTGIDTGLPTGTDPSQNPVPGGQQQATGPASPVASTANVPEPSSIALLAAGLFGAVGLRRRRR